MATVWYYLRWARLLFSLIVGVLAGAVFLANSAALLVGLTPWLSPTGTVPFFAMVKQAGTVIAVAAVVWYGPIAFHKARYRVIGTVLGNIRSFKFEGLARACAITGKHSYDTDADDNIKMCTRCGNTKWKGDRQ